jgi:hypothetical protein
MYILCRGLVDFGPHSKLNFEAFRSSVRVATIAPANTQRHVFDFLKSLQGAHQPTERRGYLLPFPGFARVFGVEIHGAPARAHVALDATALRDSTNAARSSSPATAASKPGAKSSATPWSPPR